MHLLKLGKPTLIDKIDQLDLILKSLPEIIWDDVNCVPVNGDVDYLKLQNIYLNSFDVIAAIANDLEIKKDDVLIQGNIKFIRRFRGVDYFINQAGLNIKTAPNDNLIDAYKLTKQSEKSGNTVPFQTYPFSYLNDNYTPDGRSKKYQNSLEYAIYLRHHIFGTTAWTITNYQSFAKWTVDEVNELRNEIIAEKPNMALIIDELADVVGMLIGLTHYIKLFDLYPNYDDIFGKFVVEDAI